MNNSRNSILLATLALVMLTTGAVAAAHDLRPGEAVIGETNGLAADASFDLNLAAGDEVRVSMKAKGPGDHAPAFEVRDPGGAPVAFASGERKMKLSVTAAESGMYSIHVSADADTAPRFVLKVRGEAGRKYSSKQGSVEFGAPAGAVVSLKVKASGSAWAQMSDSRGREVDLAVLGSGAKVKARTDVLSASDDYRVDYGPDGKIKVKVTYPAPRGDLRVTLVNTGSHSGQGSSGDQQGTGDQDQGQDDPADDEDEDDTADDGTNDGEITDGGGDGTAVNPPAPLTDYRFVLAILRDEAQPDLDAARARLLDWSDENVALVADLLVGEIDDAIMNDIRESISGHLVGHECCGPDGLDAMIQVVAAKRRADRARARLTTLIDAVHASSLLGDPDLDVALGEATGALDLLDDAISIAVEGGALVAILRGDDGLDALPLSAPEDLPPAAELLNAMTALDAAVLSTNVMTRARAAEADAIDLAEVLYETYDAMIAANPAALANPAQTQIAIQLVRAELDSIAAAMASAPSLTLYVDEMPMVLEGEAYELLVRVTGEHDALQMSLEVENADGLSVESSPEGLHIRSEGDIEPRTLIVWAEDDGLTGRLEIEVRPLPMDQPRHGVRAHIGDEAGHAIAGATYEVRDDIGRIAASTAIPPRLLHGESNAEGRLIINHLPEGEWVLIVTAPGHHEQVVSLTVEENADPSEVDIQEIADIVLEAE